MRLWPLGCAAVAALVALSCRSNPGLVTKGSGLYIGTASDLNPEANPGSQKAIYAGTAIPVDVKTTRNGLDFTIDLWSNGVSLESEKYQVTPEQFALVNAAGEDYSPPIPLLKFPMNVGDAWNWSGKMVTGPRSRNAEATVSTSDSNVDMGMPADAVMVQVDLRMYSGASAPATRKLQFWFVKDKGLVKREFGASTSRVPANSSSQ